MNEVEVYKNNLMVNKLKLVAFHMITVLLKVVDLKNNGFHTSYKNKVVAYKNKVVYKKNNTKRRGNLSA